uniref:C2H2-type domain-containing protein n=1 Tax=Rhizophora mucronata TaxID=61149 RepID=A0A2P2L1U1_RHIMU
MPVTKLKTSSTTDVMKPDEGNDSLDSIIRQAIGKEPVPVLSVPRASKIPAQLIQVVQALDQQDFVGWPLLTQLKVQMQKCDKCSQEFCSSINYRRHIRVHHRLKKFDKDTTKNMALLAAFWDKLSEDETKEVLSFKDVKLEEVPGSSIVKSLTALSRKPGVYSLPQYYLRAGSILLDIIQARSSRFPLSSDELFNILDDASEKTFLCGTAVSMQKYIFNGDAGKIGLEVKNLVACTSFLVEQKLVKAWLADKDAEALRCQKLLVEEEEAAQRRQKELLERKRRKKLRQKEQKSKEQRQWEKDVKEQTDDTLEIVTTSDQSCPLLASDSDTHGPQTELGHASFSSETLQPPITDEDLDLEAQTGSDNGYGDLGTGNNSEQQAVQGNSHRHIGVAQCNSPRKLQQNYLPNGFHANQNVQVTKLSALRWQGPHRDAKLHGDGKWSRKPKQEVKGDNMRTAVQKEAINQPDKIKKLELLIGSISVALGNGSCPQDNNLMEAQNDHLTEHYVPKKNTGPDKHHRHDDIRCSTNRSTVKLWRPVSLSDRESHAEVIAGKGGDPNVSCDSCARCCSADHTNGEMGNSSALEESLHPGISQFSCQAVEAFLAESMF